MGFVNVFSFFVVSCCYFNICCSILFVRLFAAVAAVTVRNACSICMHSIYLLDVCLFNISLKLPFTALMTISRSDGDGDDVADMKKYLGGRFCFPII